MLRLIRKNLVISYFTIILVSIFTTHFLLSTRHTHFIDATYYLGIFLDSFLMTGIVFPILYYFFLRPLTLEIKERRKTQIELEEAKEKAQESNKMKSEFIAQMSHEIRTPLNTIMSFSKMIKEDLENKISEEFSNEVDAIDEASKRIIRSIELILDLSEMESDSYSYNPEPFDVYEDVLSNLYEEYIDIAARKGLILKLEKTAHDSVITADKHGVTQIFSNLIDNAIKFTEKGSVEIKIYDDQKNSLTVSIIDTGIGISEHFIRELFKPFTQEDHGYTRKFDGMGLGLTLVESCCKINKAEIEVVSSKGKGTVFHITFLR